MKTDSTEVSRGCSHGRIGRTATTTTTQVCGGCMLPCIYLHSDLSFNNDLLEDGGNRWRPLARTKQETPLRSISGRGKRKERDREEIDTDRAGARGGES